MNYFTNKDQEFIEDIIHKTFIEIDRVYSNSLNINETDIILSGSRLIFPKYSSSNKTNPDKLRVSEQELRFAFVEIFSKKCESTNSRYYYSIETPTEEKYIFSEKVTIGKNYPRKADEQDLCNNKGESARFDLTIYNSEHKRICLIEFKNNDSDPDNYKKDFLKLSTEGSGCLCYFIDLIEASDSGTLIKGIMPRIKLVDKEFFKGVTYIAHCIINRGEKGFKTVYDGSLVIGDEWEKVNLYNQLT